VSGRPLRVVLVEDEPGTREALAAGLRLQGLEILAAFASGEEALAACGPLRPDVALVDLELPGISGAETARKLRAILPGTSVLVLTVFDDVDRVVEALAAGAEGYVLKGTPLRGIADAAAAARDGLVPLSPRVARRLLERCTGPRREAPPDLRLSGREREVLELLSRGHTYQSVATALGITFRTVQTHVKNLYRKLEVSSKAEAAALATRWRMGED
jgi:DNA-binding NarL/FixJ family response regulator